MEDKKKMKALYVIVNAGFTDDVVDIARREGIQGATSLRARGEGIRHKLIFGITVDTEKEIVICIADEKSVEKATKAINKEAGIKTPIHAICFVVPVEKTVGLAEDIDIQGIGPFM